MDGKKVSRNENNVLSYVDLEKGTLQYSERMYRETLMGNVEATDRTSSQNKRNVW